MIKALFFDIDGTLISFRTHRIPDSAVEALHAARKKGVRVFISTGRPSSLIDNLDAVRHLIDGYITTNGAYCYIGDEVVFSQPVSHEDVMAVLSGSDEMSFPCMFVGKNKVAIHHADAPTRRILKNLLNVDRLEGETSVEEVVRDGVYQMSPFIGPEQEALIVPGLKESVSMRWCPYFSDIFSRKANKARGLEAIVSRIGLRMEETMAFGDGENDIPILQAAGTGVSLGNAHVEVKNASSHVTSTVDDDGVRNALLYFGVI